MQHVAIVDCGSGNLRSVQKALERAAHERGLEAKILVTQDPSDLARADRVVLPGVGAFGDCLSGLESAAGLRAALDEAVTVKKRPYLGICVGMQLMAEQGLEHGRHKGFGWVKGTVAPLEVAALPVPHMGWNNLIISLPKHPLWTGLTGADHAYFVHSFALTDGAESELAAQVNYGGPLTAAVAKDNLFGVQFHPEKSQAAGLTLLGNFLEWQGHTI